ncbi:hypothetical protein [Marinobacter changyiensis]|uniref:hypothetical protein n=1 Tax=Marinobacter changyiensis TaxID=2604091 RepID=UPI00126562B0|nr:hypothetical protein [Marinobacter changyiensis]
MCGYIRRVTDSPEVAELLEELGLGDLFEPLVSQAPAGMEQIYPAFGGNSARQIRGLIIQEEGKPRLVDATWWFDCTANEDRLEVGKRTTFNVRNLDSPYWKGALRHHRGIVVATGIGESKKINGRTHLARGKSLQRVVKAGERARVSSKAWDLRRPSHQFAGSELA